MRIAMSGATGFVGGEVMAQALAERATVNALTRNHRHMKRGVRWIQGSLEDEASLDVLMAGADAVIHVAGLTGGRSLEEFERCNVDGTRHMIDAARRAGIRRFVHVSSLAAREPELSDYCRTKARGEQLVMASGLEWTIVRPPAIYGPGDTEMLELFKAARSGLLPLPPAGRLSVIAVEDLARLLLTLVPEGGDHITAVYEVDDGMPNGWSHADLGQAIGRAAGRNVRTIAMPGAMLSAAARIDILLRRDKAKLTPDRARYFRHTDWTIDPMKRPPWRLWRPRVGTEMGLKTTATAYRTKGWLKS